MKHYLNSNNRQKHQRRINYFMRKINKSIEKDELWHGRFIVRQDCAQWLPYDDNSGWELYVGLRFFDKKTGNSWLLPMKSVNSLCFLDADKIWDDMNSFIVDKCDVWGKEGREALYSDKTDWRKVKI